MNDIAKILNGLIGKYVSIELNNGKEHRLIISQVDNKSNPPMVYGENSWSSNMVTASVIDIRKISSILITDEKENIIDLSSFVK